MFSASPLVPMGLSVWNFRGTSRPRLTLSSFGMSSAHHCAFWIQMKSSSCFLPFSKTRLGSLTTTYLSFPMLYQPSHAGFGSPHQSVRRVSVIVLPTSRCRLP